MSKVEKLDNANYKVSVSVDSDAIEKRVEKLAKEASKQVAVDGFRKGKVPVAIIKKMYGDKLKEDAEGEVIREALSEAYKEAGINAEDILGEPIVEKFDKKDDKIDIELIVSTKPEIDLGDYSDLSLEYERPEVSEEEVQAELEHVAQNYSKAKKLKEDRPLKEGDIAIFDFEGFIDGEPFEGGSANNYELKIGSKTFIGDFEEQMVGMNKGEERTIKVKFPEDYQAKNLAGKEAEFKIKLNDIKEFVKPEIDDELAKQALAKEDATLEDLKAYAKDIVKSNKVRKLYEEELKPKLLEKLVEKYNFDLPKNIVEQEIDNLANQKAATLSEEEIKEIRESKEKLDELRESVREDAENSVKLTFIVDALAKKENVDVTDGEISQILYYEALMNGQDPQALIKHYQENNLLPVIKMGMIEDKLFSKLLKLDENAPAKDDEEEDS